MSLGCDYSHPLWAIYAVKWPNQCGRWLFYGRIRVCLFISAWALHCLFYCLWQCEGQDVRDKQMISSRAFFMPLLVVLFYPSCPGNARYMKNISDGNILFFIRNRNLLYFLWDYCYGGNYDIHLCLIEMYWWRYSSYHTFLLNRFCSIYSTFHSNVFNDRCHGSWG